MDGLKRYTPSEGELQETARRTLNAIGKRIRGLRTSRGLTLQQLAQACNLSSSMLSLVERGMASPSIGSLMLITNALGTSMTELVALSEEDTESPITRAHDAKVVETAAHVVRRLLKEDRTRGVSIAINEYAPHTGSHEQPLHHEGYEYGLILEGELTVEIDGVKHHLKAGDLISYSSGRNHRLWNDADAAARTVWINLQR